jgi:PRTRC genetic system protein C
MESHILSRYFEFNGVRLPDINPKLSVEEIRTAYAHQFPDIATATITGRRRSETRCGICSLGPSKG